MAENKENYCVVNPWLINVNTINKNRNHWNFIVFDRKKRDVTNEICNLAEELWLRAFGNNLYDHNIMLLPTYRNIEELTRIKLVPKDTKQLRVCSNCENDITTCSDYNKEEKISWNTKKDFKIWRYCYRILTRKK